MKTMYYIFALAFFLGTASCSSSEGESNATKDGQKSEEQAKQLGKKIPAPVINIGEFSEMSKADLRLARNTVFAKYGRVFKSKDLKEHFAKQDWYHENPRFQEKNMSQQDVDLINLIVRWEEKTEVLLKEKADITGNGSYEDCYVLYNKNKGTYTIILNDFSQEFDHFWGQNEDDQGAPSDWTELKAEIIDIDPEDFKQEVHVSQRYDDWEDPGTHNVIVAFGDGVEVTELSSTDYDAGILSLHEDGTLSMKQSNCPEHTKEYKLEKGRLVMFDETILPPPPGGCAACFTGESRVAIGENQTKRIDELQRGDIVMSYNETSGTYFETTVKRVLAVYHDNLIEISFGDQTIKVTSDHPFLTEKGWCSLEPQKTMERYGYNHVLPLETGLQLIGNTTSSEITSIKTLDEGAMTYTISTLESGNNFVVNGIVVGTETILRDF